MAAQTRWPIPAIRSAIGWCGWRGCTVGERWPGRTGRTTWWAWCIGGAWTATASSTSDPSPPTTKRVFFMAPFFWPHRKEVFYTSLRNEKSDFCSRHWRSCDLLEFPSALRRKCFIPTCSSGSFLWAHVGWTSNCKYVMYVCDCLFKTVRLNGCFRFGRKPGIAIVIFD